MECDFKTPDAFGWFRAERLVSVCLILEGAPGLRLLKRGSGAHYEPAFFTV